MPKIAVVIVNYKTPHLVLDCLQALRPTAQQLDLSVFIGDAASDDNSVEIISDFIAQEDFTWAMCFPIGRNGGFAYSNNAVVARYVQPDSGFTHVYFLNPDTYIRPGAIEALLFALQAHPQAGVVGSRLENPDGSPRAYAFRWPRPWREFFRGARLQALNRLVPHASVKIEGLNSDREVDWVTGASFMVRREVLDEIGGMDDGYFLYFEETDLMMRARAAGYAVWHVADSRVVHLAGQSTGMRSGDGEVEHKPVSPDWLASRNRYLKKHFGWTAPARATAYFLAGDLLYRLHRVLRARPIENPPHLWRTYLSARSK